MLSTRLYSIPPEVVFNTALINPELTIKDIFSYARITRACYKEFIKTIKGLWDRKAAFSSDEIKQRPLLPLLKLIDGIQRLSSAIPVFEKHKGLFDDEYKPFDTIRSEIFNYQSLTLETYDETIIIASDSFTVKHPPAWKTAELQVRIKLQQVKKMTHEIFRSRALVVLNFLAGFFDAIPFFLSILIFLSGRNFVACFLIGSPLLLVLYWLMSIDNISAVWSSVSNFLADNLPRSFTNRKMLDTSVRCGFSTAIMAIALIVGF